MRVVAHAGGSVGRDGGEGLSGRGLSAASHSQPFGAPGTAANPVPPEYVARPAIIPKATSDATSSGLGVQAAARPLHGDQRYRFPYPGGNNGLAMSSGTSSNCCST